MDTGARHMRDSAFVESVTEDDPSDDTGKADTSLDMLEQQQAREQARLLQRFRELRQWQQQQQEQLMQQQQMQLEMLRGEQLRVQTLIASQRGAHWGNGKVSKPDGRHNASPPLMTPPRRAMRGPGVGAELAKAMMAALPYASADSGLVASMGDTLEHPKDTLPRPVMYPVSPTPDDDKYTNPELFSNPGSHGDDLQAVDDRYFQDNRSDGSSDFVLPPLPPDPRESQLGSLDGGGLNSLKTLQALMSNTAPNFLQQVLGLLPAQQKNLLLEQRQAAVEESASPTFSPVAIHTARRSAPSAAPTSSAPPFTSQPASSRPVVSASQSQGHHSTAVQDVYSVSHQERVFQQDAFGGQQRQSRQSVSPPRHPQSQSPPPRHGDQVTNVKYTQETDSYYDHHHRFQQADAEMPSAFLSKQANSKQLSLSQQPQVMRRSWQEEEEREEMRGRLTGKASRDQEMDEEDEEEEELEVTVKEVRSPDDRPISGVQGKKTFEQLLEEQLAFERQQKVKEEEQTAETQKAASGPPTRPFLRKGQGIARFLQPIKRPPPKRSSGGGQKSDASRPGMSSHSSHETGAPADTGRTSVQNKPPAKRQMERKRASGAGSKDMKKMPQDKDPPQQEKLRLIKRKSETSRKAQSDAGRDCRSSETAKPGTAASKQPLPLRRVAPFQRDESIESDDKDAIPDDASFVAGIKEREKNEPMEAEELEEFELLEDIADNMSLVSNSSVVARLITPNKQRQKAAVSELKAVVEKKKNAASSPFERNAAMRSLLTVNIPCGTTNQPQGHGQSGADSDHQNDTLTEENNEKVADGGNTSEDVSITDSDNDGDEQADVEKEGKRVIETQRDAADNSGAAKPEAFSGGYFSQKGQQLNGLDFSSKFSLFGQHRQSDEKAAGLSSGSGAGGCPPSPTKSVTRKVATLQSRLSAANDTAALLQKLSARAGFLSSGFSQQTSKDSNTGLSQTLREKGSAHSADHDESQGESSFLASTMPQPLVIGGVGKFEDTAGKGLGVSVTDNLVQKSAKVRTNSDEDVSYEESEEEQEDSENADNDQDSDSDSDIVEQGVRWSSAGATSTATTITTTVTATTAATSSSSNHHVSEDNNTNNNAGFDDEEEWTSDAPQAAPIETSKASEDTSSTPPTSKLMSRLFPNLRPKPTAAQQQKQQKLQMASTTSVGDGVQSKILREKLAELETEIERFRNENANLEKLRKEREEGVARLKEEIARFEQEKTTELKRLEEFKTQETKKLKQERKLFETYQKQVRSMPDKKDREEIEMLKNQLSDLQDEMKRKESRWTSNVTRLKTRIAELEGENAELKEELKILERKRLEWIQASKSAPTSTVKSAPRSSTPTNVLTNGYLENSAPASNTNNFNIPSKPSVSSAEKTVPPSTPMMNGSGAAGKATSGSGVHIGSGGESMPRGQASTPSMIEGVSLMNLGDGGEGVNISASPNVASKTPKVPSSVSRPSVDKGNQKYEETQYSDGKLERVYSNGAREVLFANGTRKEISSDGQYIIVSFFNGDIKQIFPDQRVVYYYAEAQTTHTTYPDRLEVLQFSNGQTEKHYPDGTKEITFPDQTVKYLFPNGTEESIFQDGTIMRIDKNGERILEFPNGQREIHTQQYKRREYPDGTVKTLHNDGRQETRYSTGRVRLKDKDGNVLLDRMY